MSENSEEICHICGCKLGDNPNCIECKQYAESITLGEGRWKNV